jgi:membrane-bound metal-dependent hydrolase YbcI (DUF457 family)
MTTPEHTLVGIHAALACGSHRRWGWTAIAMAGLASNIPDWDGLPMLIDMQRFESGHRVWGHSLISILLAACLLGWTQHRYRWLEKIARRIRPAPAGQTPAEGTPSGSTAPLLVLTAIALAAQVLHLPCDMVVSGGRGLSDWQVQPFWPFSRAGFVYPLIPWGDVGPTVVLMAGIIGCAKSRDRSGTIAALTLLALVAYLFGAHLVRDMLNG